MRRCAPRRGAQAKVPEPSLVRAFLLAFAHGLLAYRQQIRATAVGNLRRHADAWDQRGVRVDGLVSPSSHPATITLSINQPHTIS